ncbi:MAG: acyl-CoA reductase [Chitinophagaceae bacterium]|nr:MAG: acyl-CoA reductase [Chitinophagaceae bacterium]
MAWVAAKEKAYQENGWFTPEFIDLSVHNIATEFLNRENLLALVTAYKIPDVQQKPANVGIIMAGNIPLVGFHDFLCTFLSGHHQTIKLSSKDKVLLQYLVEWLWQKEPSLKREIRFEEMLKGCDAYIATGSNNSSRYFEYYFSRFPHIIRKNRTSAAIVTGNETPEQIAALADDVYLYFGLGCRMINREHYMTNGSLILRKNASLFSPVSVLNYDTYQDAVTLVNGLRNNESVQCIVGLDQLPFGSSQKPRLTDFADGTDTLQFLLSL